MDTLKQVIDHWSRVPFRYGADCCSFVGDAIEKTTGTNPMAGFEYHSKTGAYRIIDEYGSLEAAITSVLGNPVAEPNDGDVCVFIQSNGTEVAGLVYDNRIIARTAKGVMDYPMQWARRFWRPQCRK